MNELKSGPLAHIGPTGIINKFFHSFQIYTLASHVRKKKISRLLTEIEPMSFVGVIRDRFTTPKPCVLTRTFCSL